MKAAGKKILPHMHHSDATQIFGKEACTLMLCFTCVSRSYRPIKP